MTDIPLLEVSGLNVSFNSVNVLKDISFSISPGELIAVIGPNGAGKTTLFRAIIGIIPYEGKVSILGRPAEKVLGRIGYVPQRFVFDKTFPLKVREFLALTLAGTDEGVIERSLEEVEMLKHKERLIGELSGGQLQRVLIARALMNSPDILFLDEPTAGVDLEGEMGFYDIIKKQNTSKGTTALLITHEINMVYRYATQVICLNRDLLCQGMPKDAVTKEVLARLYGKDVVMREHTH